MNELKNSKLEEFSKLDATTADLYYERLVELYKSDKKKRKEPCGEVRVQYTTEFDYNAFKGYYNQGKSSRSKSFHVTSIDMVEKNRSTFSFYIKLSEVKGEDLSVDDLTGIFKVSFSDGSFMYVAKWVSNEGKMRMVDSLFATEDHVWVNFIKMSKRVAKSRMKPPVGKIYKIERGTNKYVVRDKIKETPVVHSSVNNVVDDINMFFENLDQFTRWNMPGTRKVMLVGPPGTGKSSFALRIANKYMKEKNVTFFTDIDSLATHLVTCAKYNLSTICVLEDAESSLQSVNSNLLNFLDGIDQPVNSKGAYVIMTTNHPHKIEPRIIQRPGRVDAIFGFGNLTGEYVMKCADIYLGDMFFGKDRVVEDGIEETRAALRELFDADGKGITGTRIKQFSEDVLRHMVSKKKKTITMEEAMTVFNATAHDMKNVYEMATELGLLGGDKVGFSVGETPVPSLDFNNSDIL